MKFKKMIASFMAAVMVTSTFAAYPATSVSAATNDDVATIAEVATAETTETEVSMGLGEQPGHGDPVDIGTSKEQWDIKSPDGKTVISIRLVSGALKYTVSQDGVTIVEESEMGISTSKGNFDSGLAFKSASAKVIHELYQNYSGIKDVSTNYCNEATIAFTKGGVEFQLIVRAYNDGIGYRYRVEGSGDITLPPSPEITSMKLPSNTSIWYMDHKGDQSFMYEEDYIAATLDKVSNGAQPAFPSLVKVGEKFALITEAERSGTYVGSVLEVESGNVLRVKSDPVQQVDIVATAPFQTPWRTLVIGDLSTIVSNTMVENLSPAPDPQYKFEEWVQPGVSSWSWVGNWGQGISDQSKKETHMNWIDLASKMGWRYYILDEGWQPKASSDKPWKYEGMRPWFNEVRDYAKEKGVDLIAWVNKTDMDTEEECESRFKEWSEAGIKGIKIDFFYNEAQPMVQLHDTIYKTAAKYHMLVNVHGSNPPSGERRTYPNVIAREAIKGQEQGGITANQYTILPFTRGAVGTADVTEELYSKDTGKTSMGFQIALSILLENGIRSLGGKPSDYLGIPEAVSYYRGFPEKWDDVKLLDTKIGEYTNIARKAGDAWYVAGISVAARDLSLKMDCLEEGVTYAAVLYHEKDGSERSDLRMEVKKNITKDSTLNFSLQKGGGYAVKLYPQEEGALRKLTASPSTLKVQAMREKSITVALEPSNTGMTDMVWTVDNPAIASVEANEKGATVKGLKAGTTQITGTSAFDESKSFTVNVEVTPEAYPLSNTWDVINDNGKYKVVAENAVQITTENGVADKNVFAMDIPNDASDFSIEAKISGGLEDNYQGGFIGIFNPGNLNQFVGVGRRYHTHMQQGGSPNLFALMGMDNFETYKKDDNKDADAYVKLEKKGAKFTGYYRRGTSGNWQQIGEVTKDRLSNSKNLKIGFFAGCGGGKSAIDITFTDFKFNNNVYKVASKNNSAQEESFTVETDAQNGSERQTQTVRTGQKASKPADPKKGNFKFAGWYADGKEFNFNSAVTEDVLVTAKWDASYETLALEAEAMTLSGDAKIAANKAASNGALVEGIGTKGNVSFNIKSDIVDTRTLKLYYANGAKHRFQITVNDKQKMNVSGSAKGYEEVEIELQKGDNKITIAGVGTAGAPMLDRIEVAVLTDEAKTTVEKVIAGIPQNVTAEHKAIVFAMKKAYDSYAAMKGASKDVAGLDKVTAAVTVVGNEEKVLADIKKAYEELVAKVTPELDNTKYTEESIKAVQDALALAKVEYDKGEDTDGATLQGHIDAVNAAVEKLQKVAAEFVVTFDSKDGTAVEAKTVKEGSKVEAPEAPTKEGFVFGGWFTAGKEFDFDTPITQNITLSARWNEESYEALEVAKKEFETAEEEKKALEVEWDIYTEDSWKAVEDAYKAAKAEYDKDNEATAEELSKLVEALNTAIETLEENGFTVTFDAAGGTPVSAQKVRIGETATAPSTMRVGYKFEGWYIGALKYDFATPVESDIRLVAKWTQQQAAPATNNPNQDTSVKVQQITVTGEYTKVAAGKSVALSADVLPANAANKNIIWKSSNPAYASVSADGVVTATKAGKGETVVITAVAADGSGVVGEYNITIMEKAVKKIKLTASKTVTAGKKVRVKATITPKASKKMNAKLEWSSSNTKIATVNSNGIVKTKKAGKGKTVKITARATDGSGKKATISIKLK